jgi:aminopeptidase N
MRRDPHSFADDTQPETAELDWRAKIDFASRRISGEATLTLREAARGGPFDLDTRDLEVSAVTDGNGAALPWEMGTPDAILGTRLRVQVSAGTKAVKVAYRTSQSASALQWLTPEQTLGGKHPFLFSQCQAIHARSVVPLQDTPRIRITFRAELTVPAALRALMAAAFVERKISGDQAVERWHMPQPIPPYLLAFAVGELESRTVGPRTDVWAEPGLVEKAAWEFARVDGMLRAGEALFGAYDWERFDILVMPPSFPYGGMENPRLTFLTPTLIAGDRSLDSVVAHELAHSWTGNLVTNANAEHFWLNEGFTVFAERRILESLSGSEAVQLHAALGRRALERACQRFAERPSLTQLRTQLTGIDPDETFSEIPYEKGYLFLRAIEEAVGRARFDGFVRAYIDTFRFGAITSEEFAALVEKVLPGALAKVDGAAWLDGPGIPATAPLARSEKLTHLESLRGVVPGDEAHAWTPTEWQLYLEAQGPASEICRALDEKFALTASTNWEVLVAWLVLGLRSRYDPAVTRVQPLLGEVGRMKYLKPLYGALVAGEATRDVARACFSRYRERYHPIAQSVIQRVVESA